MCVVSLCDMNHIRVVTAEKLTDERIQQADLSRFCSIIIERFTSIHHSLSDPRDNYSVIQLHAWVNTVYHIEMSRQTFPVEWFQVCVLPHFTAAHTWHMLGHPDPAAQLFPPLPIKKKKKDDGIAAAGLVPFPWHSLGIAWPPQPLREQSPSYFQTQKRTACFKEDGVMGKVLRGDRIVAMKCVKKLIAKGSDDKGVGGLAQKITATHGYHIKPPPFDLLNALCRLCRCEISFSWNRETWRSQYYLNTQ